MRMGQLCPETMNGAVLQQDGVFLDMYFVIFDKENEP